MIPRERHSNSTVRADIFFFFSSRRRHTRCSRDWSSDVCSSDLVGLLFASAAFAEERTLDEIKAEAIKRAGNGMYPLIGLDPADVKQAFAAITTSDRKSVV